MTVIEIKNIFTDIKDLVLCQVSSEGNLASEEAFETILNNDNFKLEKIVSSGQSTPPGEWYDQEGDEWVIMLTGSAGLSFEDQRGIKVLKPGDYLLIPAHTIHRIEWTDSKEKTTWLAIHSSAGQKL
jgi:cupin 2 domain-containing protein